MFNNAKQFLKKESNPNKGRNRIINIKVPDFACHCPISNRLDRSTVYVCYIPKQFVIELVSFRDYISSLKDMKALHESIPCYILDNLVEIFKPNYMRITAKFTETADFDITVFEEHFDKSWKKPEHFNIPTIL